MGSLWGLWGLGLCGVPMCYLGGQGACGVSALEECVSTQALLCPQCEFAHLGEMVSLTSEWWGLPVTRFELSK